MLEMLESSRGEPKSTRNLGCAGFHLGERRVALSPISANM